MKALDFIAGLAGFALCIFAAGVCFFL